MTTDGPRRPVAAAPSFPGAEGAIDADDEAEAVIEGWSERLERGETVDPEPEIAARPHLAERLREDFAALRLLHHGTEEPDAPALVGRTLGPWRIEAVLGSGGMGTVYRAEVAKRDFGLEVGTSVAIKVVHPHLLQRPGFFKRFLREAEIGRRVRHANVVRTLDADEWVEGNERHRFLVMEYVHGRTLRALLAESGKLPEALCRHVGHEVAAALSAIHAAGAVHRDVKPDNVIVTADHVVKVMDLGVARLDDEALRLSQTGAFVGSLLYGAPEQLDGKGGIDGRTDLHALGLLLYELSTGVHPFAHDDLRVVIRRIADERPRRCGELDPQLGPFFEELVHTLLAKRPEDRFASAEDVFRVLGQGEESAWWRDRSLAIRAETRRPLRRIRIPRETSLYGRQAEIAKLQTLYDRARAGDGQVVLLEGEAGIGKSRLIDEFVGLLHQQGHEFNFLFGSYPPGGAATASGAFSTAYREHLGDDEASVRAALPQTPLLVPAFAALLRGDAAPEGSEPLTKDSLLTVFVHATRSFAAQRPTILLIDDLHFATEEGRALFMSVALSVVGHRVLLVGCTRPGLDEKWVRQLAAREQTTQLAVPRLGPKELVHLLRDALRSERLAEELAGLIAVKSDGNPFFVFEMLRGLKEGQFLAQRPDGTWHTTQVIRDIQIPSTILELVQARVADLSAEERNALDVASCLGFEFDPLLVGDVLGVPQIPLMQRLAHIEKKHRLVRSAGRRFVFDHHQVQEALYGGMPELLREPYHAAIAEAIERRHGVTAKEPEDLDGSVCVDLAEHWLKGARGSRALRYLDPALTHLERNYLNDAAVRLADRVLAEPGLVAGRDRAQMLLRKADRLDLLGRRDEQRDALDEALALADRDGDASLRAQVRSTLGWHLLSVSRNEEAMARLREAQDLARVAGDRRTEAGATGNLGVVLKSLSRYDEAKEHCERFLALARELGDRRREGIGMGNLGIVLASQGHLVDAREHYERYLALAREVGDRRGEAFATGNIGSALRALGRFAEAREHCERHLVLAREVGDRAGEANAMGNHGVGLKALGRFAESRAYQERYLALAREVGDRQGETRATACLGSVLCALGRFAEAREHCRRHLDLAREIGGRRHEGYALQFLADLAAEVDDTREAERLLSEALELRRAIGQRDGEADTLCARGALLARLGRFDEARTALGDALALAREHSLPGVELAASAHLASLPGGDVAAALAALAEHGDRVEVRTLMEVRLVLWRATRNHAHVADSKRLLDHLVTHAPPEDRESMLTNVRLHREIASAAREAGL